MMMKKETLVVLIINGLIAILISRLIEQPYFSLFLQLCLLSLGLIVMKLIADRHNLRYLLIFIILGVYALLIESISIKTGFPYSKFEYENLMGLKILDIVPWTVFFVWPTLVISAVSVSGYVLKNKIAIFFMSVAILLLLDLVFDPAATKIQFWEWQKSGIYYNVPTTNFFGWIFSSIISVVVVFLISKSKIIVNKYLSYIFIGNLCLWTILNLILDLYFPHLLGLIFTAILLFSTLNIKHE